MIQPTRGTCKDDQEEMILKAQEEMILEVQGEMIQGELDQHLRLTLHMRPEPNFVAKENDMA